MSTFRRRSKIVSADAYFVVAEIIRKIEPPEMKKAVADHFATEFNKRSRSFDPALWNRWTGGTPAPNSACTS